MKSRKFLRTSPDQKPINRGGAKHWLYSQATKWEVYRIFAGSCLSFGLCVFKHLNPFRTRKAKEIEMHKKKTSAIMKSESRIKTNCVDFSPFSLHKQLESIGYGQNKVKNIRPATANMNYINYMTFDADSSWVTHTSHNIPQAQNTAGSIKLVGKFQGCLTLPEVAPVRFGRPKLKIAWNPLQTPNKSSQPFDQCQANNS